MGSIPFGTLWIDIETGGDLGADADHAWLQAAIQRAVARIGGNRVGIYASAYEWGQVMGGYADVYSFPLWYPDYLCLHSTPTCSATLCITELNRALVRQLTSLSLSLTLVCFRFAQGTC